MDVFLPLLAAMLVAGLILALGSKLWFLARWHLTGWRPAILDPALVDQTVEACARDAVANDARDAEERHGYVMSEADKQRHHRTVSAAFRNVLEIYIKTFSTPSR